ncbi:hypothetical protein Nepgr_012013 [Nepenthes gracilis]|uniref:Uncharacterized protein n=1 Tax=Nepenthes gracilis TaxID=150966 RepID=A0AAD3SGK3_NEPGR|nr:hypothetical protein Nepgr_012013 [Nepenthes gracilis]
MGDATRGGKAQDGIMPAAGEEDDHQAQSWVSMEMAKGTTTRASRRIPRTFYTNLDNRVFNSVRISFSNRENLILKTVLRTNLNKNMSETTLSRLLEKLASSPKVANKGNLPFLCLSKADFHRGFNKYSYLPCEEGKLQLGTTGDSTSLDYSSTGLTKRVPRITRGSGFLQVKIRDGALLAQKQKQKAYHLEKFSQNTEGNLPIVATSEASKSWIDEIKVG